MLVICHKHSTATPWGCSACRGERMDEITTEAIKDFRKKLNEIFSSTSAPNIT